MAARSFRLTVLTPAETLLDVGGVAWVQARLADGGGIGIWPGHAPLVAETVKAPLRYADEAGEHSLSLEAGILQIDKGGVTVLPSGAPRRDDSVDEQTDHRELRGSLGREALGTVSPEWDVAAREDEADEAAR